MQLREEPLDEVAPIRPPVVPVELAPTLRDERTIQHQLLADGRADEAHVRGTDAHREHRTDEYGALDAFRMISGEQHRTLRAA
jgi:hypothetical protein